MLIVELTKRCAGLTPQVREAAEGYHASATLQALIASRQELGSLYHEALESHFNLVAAGFFRCALDNPNCAKFYSAPGHLQYLVWLMFTVHHPNLDRDASDATYRANQELVDTYLVNEFKRCLHDDQQAPVAAPPVVQTGDGETIQLTPVE